MTPKNSKHPSGDTHQPERAELTIPTTAEATENYLTSLGSSLVAAFGSEAGNAILSEHREWMMRSNEIAKRRFELRPSVD